MSVNPFRSADINKESYKAMRSQLDFAWSSKTLFRHCIADGVLWISLIGFLQMNSPFCYGAIAPIALLMLRNCFFMHEAVHGLGHPHYKINHLLGLLSGTFCLLPFQLWKKNHMEHHHWAGNPDKDPSYEIVKRYPILAKPAHHFMNLSWKTRLPLIALLQYFVFWGHAVRGALVSSKKVSSLLSILMPMTLWMGLLHILNAQQRFVLGLGIVCYLILFEVVNFPHHAGLYLKTHEASSHKLNLWEQHHITRTCRYVSWIEKWVVLNFNYHAEHHLFPDLPWSQLPQAHELLKKYPFHKAFHVIDGHWLPQKRQMNFGDFLFSEAVDISQSQNQNGKKVA